MMTIINVILNLFQDLIPKETRCRTKFGMTTEKGFTLIELMVVLSVTSVLGIIGIAGFVRYNEIQVLHSTTNNVISMLNLARSRALSQIKPPPSLCLGTLSGYKVEIVGQPINSYTLYVRCSGLEGSADKKIEETRILPKGLIFKGSRDFFFSVITGNVQEEKQEIVNEEDRDFLVVISGYGRNAIIKVNSLGRISMIFPKPAAAGTTPASTSTPAPPTTATLFTPRVFVTSRDYPGDLKTAGKQYNPSVETGLEGADAICQKLAGNARFGGRWRAWLSDSKNSAASRLHDLDKPPKRDPYVAARAINQTIIAFGWEDLVTRKSDETYLNNPIILDENGNRRWDERTPWTPIVTAWTNTDTNGSIDINRDKSPNSCYNWTSTAGSGSGNIFGGIGYVTAKDSTWTLRPRGSLGDSACGDSHALYCFELDPDFIPPAMIKPVPTQPPTYKRVFVTSQTYSGDLGGLGGADKKCQDAADNANPALGGEWAAWLSGSNPSGSSAISASSRLTHASLPYVLVDKTTTVADNWSDLTDGSIAKPITKNENNEQVTSRSVWTNTRPNGSYYADNNIFFCNNWTRTDSVYGGPVGNNSKTDANWTIINSNVDCLLRPASLYCFEQ